MWVGCDVCRSGLFGKWGGLFVLYCCVGFVLLRLCGLIYTVEWARARIALSGLHGDDSAICYRVRRDFEACKKRFGNYGLSLCGVCIGCNIVVGGCFVYGG